MSILTDLRKVSFISDGVAVTYPFGFKMLNPDEVAVAVAEPGAKERNLAYGVDYYVVLHDDTSEDVGGVMTLNVPVANGTKIVVYSAMNYLQPTEVTKQDAFYPFTLNDSLDRAAIQIQQLLEWAGRAVVLPITAADELSGSLPPPESDMFIGWNREATKLINKSAIQSNQEPWVTIYSADINTTAGTKQKLTLEEDAVLSFTMEDGEDLTLLLNSAEFNVSFAQTIVWFDRPFVLTPDKLNTIVISKDKDSLYGWWQVEA